MKLKNFILLSILLSFTSVFAASNVNVKLNVVDEATSANEMLLPDPLPVFTDGKFILNHPEPGFILKKLPSNNDFKETPGCYIACYSHQEKGSIYAVTSDTYVHGQIRVPGSYRGRICIPTNYDGIRIDNQLSFKILCNEKFKTCNQDCWAGGDTGGWFGLLAN